MKWGRLFGATLVVAIASYLVGSVLGAVFAPLYDPTSGLWRAMLTPIWVQNVILSHVIVSFLSVFAYSVVHTGLGKKAQMGKKGLKFAMVLWLLHVVPGSVVTYTYMPVPLLIVASWVAVGLVSALINGQITARIYK